MSTLGLDLFTGDIVSNLKRREIEARPIVLATKFDGSNHQNLVLEAMREGATQPDREYDMFETVIPNRPEFAANPVELGADPTLSQKWPGEALPVIESLYEEVRSRLQ